MACLWRILDCWIEFWNENSNPCGCLRVSVPRYENILSLSKLNRKSVRSSNLNFTAVHTFNFGGISHFRADTHKCTHSISPIVGFTKIFMCMHDVIIVYENETEQWFCSCLRKFMLCVVFRLGYYTQPQSITQTLVIYEYWKRQTFCGNRWQLQMCGSIWHLENAIFFRRLFFHCLSEWDLRCRNQSMMHCMRYYMPLCTLHTTRALLLLVLHSDCIIHSPPVHSPMKNKK